MPKKEYIKKKKEKEVYREKVGAGMVNMPNGDWKTPREGEEVRAYQHMAAGYGFRI